MLLTSPAPPTTPPPPPPLPPPPPPHSLPPLPDVSSTSLPPTSPQTTTTSAITAPLSSMGFQPLGVRGDIEVNLKGFPEIENYYLDLVREKTNKKESFSTEVLGNVVTEEEDNVVASLLQQQNDPPGSEINVNNSIDEELTDISVN